MSNVKKLKVKKQLTALEKEIKRRRGIVVKCDRDIAALEKWASENIADHRKKKAAKLEIKAAQLEILAALESTE